MKFCPDCGTKLSDKYNSSEKKPIPYCKPCRKFCFPPFSCAVIAAVINSNENRVLLIKHKNDNDLLLLSGFIERGENAEQALCRECREEVGITLNRFKMCKSWYFAPDNTLIIGFWAITENDTLSPNHTEIGNASWFSFDNAIQTVKQNTLAQTALVKLLDDFQKNKPSACG